MSQYNIMHCDLYTIKCIWVNEYDLKTTITFMFMKILMYR